MLQPVPPSGLKSGNEGPFVAGKPGETTVVQSRAAIHLVLTIPNVPQFLERMLSHSTAGSKRAHQPGSADRAWAKEESSMSKRIKRRQFLAGVAAAGPAISLLSATGKAAAQPAPASSVPPVPQDERSLNDMPPLTEGKSGSDFMVDVIKTLNIDYCASVPGSTFRGLHESMITYGGNKKPEFI